MQKLVHMTETNQTLCNVCSETCGFLLSLRHLPDSAYAVLPPFAQGSLLRCFSVRVGQGWAQSLPPPPVLPGVPTATSGPWLSSSFGTSVPCPLLPSPLLFSGLSTLLEQGHTLTSGPWHVLFHLPRRLFPLQIPPPPPGPNLCSFPVVFKFLYVKCTLHPHLTPFLWHFLCHPYHDPTSHTSCFWSVSPPERSLLG